MYVTNILVINMDKHYPTGVFTGKISHLITSLKGRVFKMKGWLSAFFHTQFNVFESQTNAAIKKWDTRQGSTGQLKLNYIGN